MNYIWNKKRKTKTRNVLFLSIIVPMEQNK